MGSAPGIDWLRFLSGSTLVGALKCESTVLTNTQIKGLPSAAVNVSTSAPAGKYCIPLLTVITINSTAGAYTNIDAAAYAWVGAHTGGSPDTVAAQSCNLVNDVAVPATGVSDLFGSAGVNAAYLCLIQQTNDYWWTMATVIAGITGLMGLPLALTVNNGSSGNFTGGHTSNTGLVTAFYLVL